MSIIALYVYAPTTFTTDSPIESMRGEFIGAGQVTLQPGIYRLHGGATISATAAPHEGASYSIIPHVNAKDGPPDPPISPMGGYTMSEITTFFGGAGEANAI